MELADVERRIAYFHDADDDYLALLGVERSLLPEPADWRASYAADLARPLPEREQGGAMWLLAGEPVGWCNIDQIEFGEQARMHLHMADPERRADGLGSRFVSLCVDYFFTELGLQRLFCAPRAENTAPHRTVQRAGFRFVSAQWERPGPINAEQMTIRWVREPSRTSQTASI